MRREGKSKKVQYNIILASKSPRRKYLLKMLMDNFGLKFTVNPSNIVELIPKNLSKPSLFVQQLALDKALDVASKHSGLIISADTIVVLDREVLGKPRNKKDARSILRKLSGKKHKVYTGISIVETNTKRIFIDYEVTQVKFRNLLDGEINYYIDSGSPMDKAGAYGIQDDFGSTFIEKINGDYFNVVGLPIVKTYLGLKNFIDLTI